MDGGIWTVTTESLGKGQHAQRQSMWTVCARRKCPGSGRCAQHCVSTCNWLHSAVVMGLHWVAVTWAQSIDMLGNAASTPASFTC